MPCPNPGHTHEWPQPQEGIRKVLTIQACEHICGYCDDDHTLSGAFRLRGHVRSKHLHKETLYRLIHLSGRFANHLFDKPGRPSDVTDWWKSATQIALSTPADCEFVIVNTHTALQLHENDNCRFPQLVTAFLRRHTDLQLLIAARTQGQSIAKEVAAPLTDFLDSCAATLWPVKPGFRGHLLKKQHIMTWGDTTRPRGTITGPVACLDTKMSAIRREEWAGSYGDIEPTVDQETLLSDLGTVIGAYMHALIDSWANGEAIPGEGGADHRSLLREILQRKGGS